MLDGQISRYKITRFLNGTEYSSKDLWEYVKPNIRKIEETTGGVLILDDSVEEKPYTDENELISWHYSHAKKRCVKGINILSCFVWYGDLVLLVSYEPILKVISFCDIKTKKKDEELALIKTKFFEPI